MSEDVKGPQSGESTTDYKAMMDSAKAEDPFAEPESAPLSPEQQAAQDRVDEARTAWEQNTDPDRNEVLGAALSAAIEERDKDKPADPDFG